VPVFVWRAAEGDIVSSYCLDDGPDGVHHDIWFVDSYNVTGLASDDEAPAL
jgi:hypothetical protein